MKKAIQLSFMVAFLLIGTVTTYAQTECKFTFKGSLAGKSITMCFYEDDNDGNVKGEYYYGAGKNGVMTFTGTAILQADGSYAQRLEERNAKGVVTGYFTGSLKKGVMTGTWTNTDGSSSFKYILALPK